MSVYYSETRRVIEAHGQDFKTWIDEGATLIDIADRLRGLGHKICWSTVKSILADQGLVAPVGNRLKMERAKEKGKERAARMAALYRDGYTLQQIGDQYSITRERVRQILVIYFKMDRKEGGISKKAAKKREVVRNEKLTKCFKKHGCSYTQYRELLRIGREMVAAGYGRCRTPTGAYITQHRNSVTRGIEWKLNLWQWWCIWQESGHWAERGRGQGYVMCRKNDSGAYEIGNVYIASALENNSNHPGKKHGLPMGVHGKNGRYTARRKLNGKMLYLGTHTTPELAHAAYLAANPKAA